MPKFSETADKYLKSGSAEAELIILQYIQQDRVQEDEEQWVYNLLIKAKNSYIKLNSFLWLSAKSKYLEKISELWEISEAQIKAISEKQPKIALFPVVDSQKNASLAKAFIYKLESSEPKAIAILGDKFENFGYLAKLGKQNCIIGFDTNITGNSWQLAVLATLLAKDENLISKIAFSGIVLPSGDIITAEEIEAKKCCYQQLVYRVKNYAQLDAWLNTETIPIPIIQYQGEESELIHWQKALEEKVQEKFSWFSYELMEDFYGITTKDLAIFGKGTLPFDENAWQKLLREQVKDKFPFLEDKVMPKKVLWFYAGQISTLQLGIGALFGFKRAVSILQMEFSHTTYSEVFTLYGKENARQLKNVSVKKEDYQYIQSELLINEPLKNELGFIIYLGSHNPIGEAKDFCQNNLQVNNFLIIKAKQNQGVMETSQNWLPFVQEINSALNAAREKNHWQRIHLFQTAPIALCMALGIAIGHFVPIDVYHYQFNASEPKYRCMFSMDKILSL